MAMDDQVSNLNPFMGKERSLTHMVKTGAAVGSSNQMAGLNAIGLFMEKAVKRFA